MGSITLCNDVYPFLVTSELNGEELFVFVSAWSRCSWASVIAGRHRIPELASCDNRRCRLPLPSESSTILRGDEGNRPSNRTGPG